MSWHVHRHGKVHEWDEVTVRRMLAGHELTGVELVREPGSDDWRPLHSTPLYSQVVPHTGDPRSVAHRRLRSGFVVHATVFAVVMAVLWFKDGAAPPWATWWALAVMLHGVATFRTARQARRATPPRTVDLAQRVATPPRIRPDNELLLAIDALTTAGWGQDTSALQQTARELIARRALAEDALAKVDRDSLANERQLVVADRDQADALTAQALDEQLAAIDGRLAFIDDAKRLAIRLRARERTLLHQLASLRLGVLSAGDDTPGSELSESVTRLRRELEADSEVSDALARARAADPS